MAPETHEGIVCNHWVAQVHPKTGRPVSIHIHRGSPIPVADARRIARKAAPFGKLASLSPLGVCSADTGDADC